MGAIMAHHGLLLAGSGGGAASDPYRDAVMADSPWAYWRLNETSGTAAADSSGNGRLLACHNGFSAITSAGLLASSTDAGVLLPAAAASVASGFVRSIDTQRMPPTDLPFTAECLIKPTATPPESVGVILALGVSNGCPEIDVIDIGGGSFRIRVMAKGIAALVTSTGSWAYGTKLHVAARRDPGDVIRLIVNGVVDANSGTYNYSNFDTQPLTIGYAVFSTDQYHMTGNMDEVALYASALTDARLLAHYNASL